MGYTAAEKVAGRTFREAQQRALAASFRADPPHIEVPHFIGVYRHACPARTGRTLALPLSEVYRHSPAYDVFGSAGNMWWAMESDRTEAPEWAREGDVAHVPAGRFGFIYRAGRCKGCGRTARSRSGRLVDGWLRPPIHTGITRRPA